MAKVVFPDHLLQHTGGLQEVDILVENYRDLLVALEERWPGIRAPLDKSAVAIDGQIYQDAFLESINAHSEVFFLSRIEGG